MNERRISGLPPSKYFDDWGHVFRVHLKDCFPKHPEVIIKEIRIFKDMSKGDAEAKCKSGQDVIAVDYLGERTERTLLGYHYIKDRLEESVISILHNRTEVTDEVYPDAPIPTVTPEIELYDELYDGREHGEKLIRVKSRVISLCREDLRKIHDYMRGDDLLKFFLVNNCNISSLTDRSLTECKSKAVAEGKVREMSHDAREEALDIARNIKEDDVCFFNRGMFDPRALYVYLQGERKGAAPIIEVLKESCLFGDVPGRGTRRLYTPAPPDARVTGAHILKISKKALGELIEAMTDITKLSVYRRDPDYGAEELSETEIKEYDRRKLIVMTSGYPFYARHSGKYTRLS